jgi:hypothetical protein
MVLMTQQRFGKQTFRGETVSKDSKENTFQTTDRTIKPKGLWKTNKSKGQWSGCDTGCSL